ncbi:cytochrome P450 [Xylariaceae sp. FL1272]|nr:cytochrome P450 [Xylariaceae sp. FL1272]
MALLQVVIVAMLLCGGIWVSNNVWLFPSRHNHGEDQGCGRITLLPSSWRHPFGLDKLLTTLRAEKQRRLPLLTLEEHDKHGDTYAQYAGGLFTVITRDPRNIAAVLSTKFDKFSHGTLRKVCFGILLGEGIFTANGDSWARSRRMIGRELHKPGFLRLYVLEAVWQEFMTAISKKQSKEGTVDVKALLFDYVLDTATGLFLGKSTDLLSSSNPEGQRFSEAFNKALRWLAIRERLKMFAWVVYTPGLVGACATARDYLEKLIIEAQRDEKISGSSVFTEFLGQCPDLGKARDEVMNLLLAGRDTNASLLCWVVLVLARERGVWERLEDEVMQRLGRNSNRTPTEVDLAEMDYLDDVVNETLRFFPPVPINGRVCCEDTALPTGGGKDGSQPIKVPKGTLIWFSTYACHHSTKLYGDGAEKFRPERWREVGVKTRTLNYSYHPFIGGPRKCLGENFAITQAKYVLCRMVQCFGKVEIEDPSYDPSVDWKNQIRYQVGLTMSPENELKVKMAARA